MLALRQVTKVYKQADGSPLSILRGVDFELRKGELVGLVGPSGSGKSTLLHMCGLLDQPTSGEVVIEGQLMRGLGDGGRTRLRRIQMGFVYQFHHLLPEFTAQENVAFPLWLQGRDKKSSLREAHALLDALGLSERRDHLPNALSGGEQQRVAIARALIHRPALIFADEPTGNLDPETSDRVFTLMLDTLRKSQAAALIATHNMELAGRLDRVVKLERGVLQNL